MALGAHAPDVLRTVVTGVLRLALPGAAFGTVGALLTGRVLRQQLFGVGLFDPSTIDAVTAVLAGVAGLASFVPARHHHPAQSRHPAWAGLSGAVARADSGGANKRSYYAPPGCRRARRRVPAAKAALEARRGSSSNWRVAS